MSISALPRLDARALLREHGIRPRRRLGQNFLQDPVALERIAAEARIEASDTVLEIGCGLGSLTRHLALRARSVVAVELDAQLASIARTVLASSPNVRIVCADILKLTPRELGLPSDYIVAANIPYYVTSPILRHLLESRPQPQRIVLTVQKEVAERVCASPPRMSLLALSVQVYASAAIVMEVPAAAFFPVPKVDSAVVRIEAYEAPAIPPNELPTFFTLVRAGFSQRRKTLRNALASGLVLPPSQATELLARANIDPRRRAETLTLAEWAHLTQEASSTTPTKVGPLSPAS